MNQILRSIKRIACGGKRGKRSNATALHTQQRVRENSCYRVHDFRTCWDTVKSALRVASPPAKPVMIFDGECNFCRVWIQRWQQTTGERVDYMRLQDESVAARFPELGREQLEQSVHL